MTAKEFHQKVMSFIDGICMDVSQEDYAEALRMIQDDCDMRAGTTEEEIRRAEQ